MPRERTLCITEAAIHCRAGETRLRMWIQREWIVPLEQQTGVLDEEDLARANLIRELQDDLGVNDEAVPIILHLLDQLHALRREMRGRLKAG